MEKQKNKDKIMKMCASFVHTGKSCWASVAKVLCALLFASLLAALHAPTPSSAAAALEILLR